MKSKANISTNIFVDNADMGDDAISPMPKIITRSESAKKLSNDLVARQSSIDSVGSFKKPAFTKPQNKPVETEQRPTMDVSDEEKSEGAPKAKDSIESQDSSEEPKKKRKRRRDVIFKTILRECRRYFQIQLSDLTGFISSKKPRNDDYMYKCMEKFNKEFLKMNGSFEENFYLACLLYPQDLIRNLDHFLQHKQGANSESKRKMYKQTATKIHDTLYKYSHDKLDFFVSKTELSFLFCYFYEKGSGVEKEDPKFADEYEFIRNKCMDRLNRAE